MASSSLKDEEVDRTEAENAQLENPPGKEEVMCDRCGQSMFRMRAVYWCERCGYKTDCCGH